MCGGNVLGDVVVQVQLMGKVVCAGGIWGPALTSTLFLWPALKGGFGVGAREVGRHLGVSGWKAGPCRPLMCSKCVTFISTICPAAPVEPAVIWWRAELGGY